MRRWITRDDFIESYHKIAHRGLSFLRSKFTFDSKKRTLSAFDDVDLVAPHWWIIPKVRLRWSKLICGDENQTYEDYFVKKHFSDKHGLKVLSIGSGICSHELALAEYPCFEHIHCIDIAGNLLAKAEEVAKEKGLKNISFEVADLYKKSFDDESFDLLFFHASLHHFDDINSLLSKRLKPILKEGGWVVINEYVGPNRLQFSKSLIEVANKTLQSIPNRFRTRYKSTSLKTKITGAGLLRMILADPSECVDSSVILPTLRNHFNVVEERPYGGNILVPVLKDIAHHFVDHDHEKEKILNEIFKVEDEYLENHESHYIFGIYQKSTACD